MKTSILCFLMMSYGLSLSCSFINGVRRDREDEKVSLQKVEAQLTQLAQQRKAASIEKIIQDLPDIKDCDLDIVSSKTPVIYRDKNEFGGTCKIIVWSDGNRTEQYHGKGWRYPSGTIIKTCKSSGKQSALLPSNYP